MRSRPSFEDLGQAGVSFITARVANAKNNNKQQQTTKNKTKSNLNRDGTFLPLFSFSSSFSPGTDPPLLCVRTWTLCCFHSLISTQAFGRALTAPLNSSAEEKSAPSVASAIPAELGGRCRKAILGVWC